MIDVHTHILPGMDDGSQSVRESAMMLRLISRQNIDGVCLTPHFYPDQESPNEFLRRRKAAYEQLMAGLAGREWLPKLYLGAEVVYYEGISRSDWIENLTIGSSRVVLLEMPFRAWTKRMFDDLQQLRSRNLHLMIAHAERFIDLQKCDLLSELNESHMLIQINASWLLDHSTARTAWKELKNGRVHVIGSDCHNLEKRYPNLGDAMEQIRENGGDNILEHMSRLENRLLTQF